MVDRSYYDIETRSVHLAPNATLFTAFHEYAHAEQHENRTWPFLTWRVLHQVRLLGYFAILWIEWDANRRARNAMKKNGVWNKEARQIARRKFLSYVFLREDR